MESILSGLKISNVLNPRGFRIPNCDRKGFYKKKQVSSGVRGDAGRATACLNTSADSPRPPTTPAPSRWATPALCHQGG